ncbi:MAG TPA: hypothetical protein VJI13_01870, partial [Candidatus Norongarragalinales archaeon]|nr:hypothetical protein [Candidatus Norongarragalinales archaeon]
MRKIALIFSEAALELVPKEIVSNPMFAEEGRKRHKKPGEILLDSNKHNLPMRSLGNPDRRGRPDILHFSLLAAMETLANKAGLLQQISVHTLDGTLLEISREARLPRIYNRFCGIMEQVLAGGENQFIKMTGPIPFKDVLSGVMPKLRGKEHAAPIFF